MSDEATRHYLAAAGLGRLLNRDPNGVLIVRMVGIAAQQYSLKPLVSLFESAGDTKELQRIRTQLADLERQHAEMRRMAGG